MVSWGYEKTPPGWWLSHPSEKYEFVSWDDDIPNIWKNNPNVPNHQPESIVVSQHLLISTDYSIDSIVQFKTFGTCGKLNSSGLPTDPTPPTATWLAAIRAVVGSCPERCCTAPGQVWGRHGIFSATGNSKLDVDQRNMNPKLYRPNILKQPTIFEIFYLTSSICFFGRLHVCFWGLQ